MVDYDSFITNIELEKVKFLEDLKSKFNIKIPSGVGFNREISNRIDKYNLVKENFLIELEKFNSNLNKLL